MGISQSCQYLRVCNVHGMMTGEWWRGKHLDMVMV